MELVFIKSEDHSTVDGKHNPPVLFPHCVEH